MAAEERDSFIFYRSFREALDYLDDQAFRELTVMIMDRALDRKEVHSNNKLVSTFYNMIEPNIDANHKKFKDGKKGGRPRKKPVVKNEKTSGFVKNNHRIENNKPNVDVNGNENDTTINQEQNKYIITEEGFTLNTETGEEVPF